MTIHLYETARLLNTKEYRVFSKLPLIPNWFLNKRFDSSGKLIIFEHYGNRYFTTGWEIDHIIPTSKGGTDDLSNLQALQWATNLFKSDNTLIQTLMKLAEKQTKGSAALQSNQPNNPCNTYNNYLYHLLYGQR